MPNKEKAEHLRSSRINVRERQDEYPLSSIKNTEIFSMYCVNLLTHICTNKNMLEVRLFALDKPHGAWEPVWN